MAEMVLPGVPFAEAIAYLRARLKISDAEWVEIQRSAGIRAFRSATDMTEAMRRDLLAAVLEAMEEGRTAQTFRDDYERIADAHGWSAEGSEPGWHADLIFRVETNKARAAGRWEQMQRVKQYRPYIRYVTMGDHRVRPEHRAWHGIVLPADHPFWLTHWPPNGFNCRCITQSLNERDLARYGYTVTPDDDPFLTLPPDAGWSGNEGIAWEQLRQK